MGLRAAKFAAAAFGLAWLLTCLPGPAVAAPGASLRPLLLEMTVNQSQVDEPQLFVAGPDGALYASETALHRARLHLPKARTIRYDGETFYRIDDVPALRAAVSEAGQSVTIEADPRLFDAQIAEIGGTPLPLMTRPATGLFLNYDLYAERSNGASTASGAFEINGFTPAGVATSSFVAHAGDRRASAVRLETSFTVDRPNHMSSLRIGDSIARGGVGGVPFRFAGLQFGRNFATQPGFITMPLPSLSGSAALPSTIDVYVNNALQGSQAVQSGPFQLNRVPVDTGDGSIRLVMHDVLGREIVVDQDYYASRDLLRRNLRDFSYEIGFIRKDFGIASNRYGPLMASGSERWGLSNRMTVEAHAAATARVQNAGAGLDLLIGRFGIVTAEAAMAMMRGRVSTLFSGGIEHRSAGLSVGIQGRITGRSYQMVGAYTPSPSPRLDLAGYADFRLANRISVGLNAIVRTRYGAPSERIAGANARIGLGRIGGLQLYARYAQAERRSVAVGLSFSLLLQQRRSATLSVDTEQGRPTAYAELQSNPPAGVGSGWRVSAQAGAVDGVSGAYTFNAPASSLSVEAAKIGNQTGVRASAAGSIGLVNGRTFASRRLGDSFASVSVGGYGGVRVYADNQLVARTDKSGRAIVPGLRSYETNQIRIEDADLPIEAQLAASETDVRPFARTGVMVNFAPVATSGAVLWASTSDGAALPAGASVAIDGRTDGTVVAPGGMIYVPNATGEIGLTVRWDGHACRVTALVAPGAGPQPVLRGLVCRTQDRVASR